MKSTLFPSLRAWHMPAVSQWPPIQRARSAILCPPRCPADSPRQLLRFQRRYRASLQVSPPARGSRQRLFETSPRSGLGAGRARSARTKAAPLSAPRPRASVGRPGSPGCRAPGPQSSGPLPLPRALPRRPVFPLASPPRSVPLPISPRSLWGLRAPRLRPLLPPPASPLPASPSPASRRQPGVIAPLKPPPASRRPERSHPARGAAVRPLGFSSFSSYPFQLY